jgi:hypothetical protein
VPAPEGQKLGRNVQPKNLLPRRGGTYHLILFWLLEDISFFEGYFKLSEEMQVFLPERSFVMVCLLVFYIINNIMQLRARIRKSTIAFLPAEMIGS